MLQIIIPIALLLAVFVPMVVAAEVIVGKAVLNGIQGAITMTGAAPFNMSDRTLTDDFKNEELPAQNGATIETVIASQRKRDYECTFVPTGAARADVIAVMASFAALKPLDVITVANSTVVAYNGSYNYMGGATIKETRDGYAVCGIKLRQYETAATSGTFAALAIAS